MLLTYFNDDLWLYYYDANMNLMAISGDMMKYDISPFISAHESLKDVKEATELIKREILYYKEKE